MILTRSIEVFFSQFCSWLFASAGSWFRSVKVLLFLLGRRFRSHRVHLVWRFELGSFVNNRNGQTRRNLNRSDFIGKRNWSFLRKMFWSVDDWRLGGVKSRSSFIWFDLFWLARRGRVVVVVGGDNVSWFRLDSFKNRWLWRNWRGRGWIIIVGGSWSVGRNVLLLARKLSWTFEDFSLDNRGFDAWKKYNCRLGSQETNKVKFGL